MANVLLFLLNKMSIFDMYNFCIYLYDHFFNNKFELAHIGDLSSYSYDELSIKLSHFEKTVQYNHSFMIVTWESARTILKIEYDFDKQYIKRVSEVWK
jgi:hypothetical protein